MDAQVTLRLPRDLARALAREAKSRGVKRSQLVREAVTAYLAQPASLTPEQIWERTLPFLGDATISHEEAMKDDLSRIIYEHNFRP